MDPSASTCTACHACVAQWPASSEQRSWCRRLGRSQYAADLLHRARRGAGERRFGDLRRRCRRRRRQHRHAAAIVASSSVVRERSLNAAMGRSSPARRPSASTCSAERGALASTTSSRTASRWIGAATPRSAAHRGWQRDGSTRMVGIICPQTPEGSSCQREMLWDWSLVRYTRVPAPPARRAADYRPYVRSAAMASISRHSTIRRRQTNGPRSGCSAHVRWAKARISSWKDSFIREIRSAGRTGTFILYSRTGRVDIPADNFYNPFGVDPVELRSPLGRGRQPRVASRMSICGAR